MHKRIVLVVTTAAAVALLVLAPVAYADLTDVGKSASEQLGGFARGLFVGLVALVALGLLLARRIQELAVFVAVACIVGVFVMAPDEAAGLIEDTAQVLTGG